MILVYHLGHCVERLVLLFSLRVWNVNCSQREISRLPDLDLYFPPLFFFSLPQHVRNAFTGSRLLYVNLQLNGSHIKV